MNWMDVLVKAYFWAAGKKTITGAALNVAGRALEAAGYHQAAVVVDQVSGVLITLGLADKAGRAVAGVEAPK